MKRRRVHLAGHIQTACGLILGGAVVSRPSLRHTPPAWRCPRCEAALAAWLAGRAELPAPPT